MAPHTMTSSRGSLMVTKGYVTLDVAVQHGNIAPRKWVDIVEPLHKISFHDDDIMMAVDDLEFNCWLHSEKLIQDNRQSNNGEWSVRGGWGGCGTTLTSCDAATPMQSRPNHVSSIALVAAGVPTLPGATSPLPTARYLQPCLQSR
ncbi:hypothetical protein J6590_078941 [Homalodisca vitripennis]|nr:hypothetical protein J6590_078941 [Homalodisca vitripennis]